MTSPQIDLVSVSTDGLTDTELRRMVMAYHQLAADEDVTMSHRRWYLRLARQLAAVVRRRDDAFALLAADSGLAGLAAGDDGARP